MTEITYAKKFILARVVYLLAFQDCRCILDWAAIMELTTPEDKTYFAPCLN